MIKVTKVRNDVEKSLDEMINKANFAAGYLARVVYPTYLESQKERWATDNSGEDFTGGAWRDLKNKRDKYYKAIKYAAYPGGGTKKMVREGSLYLSIVDKSNSNHEAIFLENSMTVSTAIKYAGFLDDGTSHMEARPFSGFSDTWKSRILSNFEDYVAGIA